MIYLGNVNEIDPSYYDEVWVICRKVEDCQELIEGNDNVFHMPGLAPSQELFSWYRGRLHNGTWDENAFQDHYIPEFLEMFRKGSEACRLMKQLTEESRSKEIVLVCFCVDETLCHRSIVGGILMKMGAWIDCDPKYGDYGEMLKKSGDI